MMSMMSGCPFTPIISFVCSFFVLSILDFFAELLSTSISVDKILFDDIGTLLLLLLETNMTRVSTVVNVTCMGRGRNVYRFMVGKSEGKILLGKTWPG